MAYLGWRPSGDAGNFSPIPESFYTAPHAAVVTAYEDAKGPLLHFEPAIADSVWPVERSEGQYTRVRFTAGKSPPLPEGTKYQWDFGDGQTANGAEVDHVYLTMGLFNVTLTAQGPAGRRRPTGRCRYSRSSMSSISSRRAGRRTTRKWPRATTGTS